MSEYCNRNNSAFAVALLRTVAFFSVCFLSAAPGLAQPQPAGKYRFIIGNQTKLVVEEVRLSASGENNWGADYTGTNVLKPGQAITMADLAPGQYDVKFTDSFGNACVLKNIPVFSEMSWNLTDAWADSCAGFGQSRGQAVGSSNNISIKNNSRLSMLEVRTSPGGANQWGPDRTGDATLRPGGTFVVKELAAGEYDIKFVVEDGDTCVLKGLKTADHPTWNLTMQWLRGCGEDGTRHARSVPPSESGFLLTVNNNTRHSLYEIRVSPAGANKWGNDRTSDLIVRAGDSIILKNLKAGQYDIKIVDEDGDACILKGIDVSRHQAWNLTMQSLRSCEEFGPRTAALKK